MSLRAEISLTAPDGAPLGEARIALLEAIGREGGISAAARALGLSYRGAWDAIHAMNALVGRPLVLGQTGGRGGGGARLTEEGVRLVGAFRRLQDEMASVFQSVAPEIGGRAGPPPRPGFRRTSARNALRGRIIETREGPVSAEAALEIAEGAVLRVTLTRLSLRALNLFPGQPAVALVKAPLVRLERPGAERGSGGVNRLAGLVARVAEDAGAIEIELDLGAGGMLCAIIQRGADAPAFAPGDRALALIDPAHIILAVE